MIFSNRSRRWWLVFAVCLAAPALALATLGLRTIDLERIERRDQIDRQQRQIAMLADTRIKERLLQVIREPPSGGAAFTLDRSGRLVFPLYHVYLADLGDEPPQARPPIPREIRDLAEQALGAEARSESQRAAQIFGRLAHGPQLGGWARLGIARLRMREQPESFRLWFKDFASQDQNALSPEGTPVMLLATSSVDLMAGRDTALCIPFLSTTLANLRAGRWWLSFEQKKVYDEQLTRLLTALGNDSPAGDSRLAELDSIARVVRRLAPFTREGTTALPAQESGVSLLLVASARPGDDGGWAGVVLSGQPLADFLQAGLGSIRKEVNYPLALTDSLGHLIWGEPAALYSSQRLPLSAVMGWDVRAGEPAQTDRRQFLWYAFVIFLLLMLAFGVAMTMRITGREMELARMQADFAAGVTHEFKSPITCIRLAMERIIAGRVHDTASLSEYHNSIWRQTDRLEGLVNRLLETHRIDSGKNQYHFAPHNIVDIADTAIAHLRTQAEAKNINLTLEADDTLREIDVDRTAIQDSIENLIDNAIKYSPPGRHVQVVVRYSPQEFTVTVQDQGNGIPPADLPRIFERFYRSRNDPQPSVRGTGLGLPLVKAVAEGHGGSVDVRSVPGQGSEFCIHIPIRLEETYVAGFDRG